MNSFVQNLFEVGLYKRNQGRLVRQGTGFALALIFFVAAYRLEGWLQFGVASDLLVRYFISGLLFAFGAWFSYRIVNWPRFADFLVSVEAEMNKVSWPTRQELIRSSVVVLVVLFFLAIVLFAYDIIWAWLIQQLTNVMNFLFVR